MLRLWHQALFDDVYAHCFYALDVEGVQVMRDAVERELTERKNARQVRRRLQEELARETVLQQDLPTSSSESESRTQQLQSEVAAAKERAGTKRQRRTLKQRRTFWLKQWEYMTDRRDSVAKLIFHPGTLLLFF